MITGLGQTLAQPEVGLGARLGILRVREEGALFCNEREQDPDRCRTLAEANLEGQICPPVRLPVISQTFVVVSRARVGEIERSAEAVVSLESLEEPRLLSWRVR